MILLILLPHPCNNQPVCQIRAHEIPEIAKWAEDPLINSNCEIYQRGGSAS
jgi:hypothetical protein